MRFIRYNGMTAVIVRTGVELTAEAGGDLDDHLGVWFGESDDDGNPIVWSIPAEYVDACSTLTPTHRH